MPQLASEEDRIAKKHLWHHAKRVTLALLLAWLLINLGLPWFARDLDAVQMLGLPLAWWLASQGALLLYLAIIVIDVVVMERLEAQYLKRRQGPPADAAAPPQGTAPGEPHQP